MKMTGYNKGMYKDFKSVLVSMISDLRLKMDQPSGLKTRSSGAQEFINIPQCLKILTKIKN
jgi:hypothetical protein